MKKQIIAILSAASMLLTGCGSSSSDTADLQKQIDDLKSENESLKQQLAEAGSTPKPTPKPSVTAESTDYDYTYKVLRWNSFTDSIGEHEFRILIEIHNTSAGSIRLESTGSNLDIEDTNGHLVDTGQTIYGYYPDVVSAGETGYLFGDGFIRDDGSVAPEDMRPVLNLNIYESSYDPENLETSDTSMSNSYGMYERITGRVENTTDTATSPFVGAFLYDSDGKLLAVGSIQADYTEPGDKTSTAVSVDIEGTDFDATDVADYKLVAQSTTQDYSYMNGDRLTGKEITEDTEENNTADVQASVEKHVESVETAKTESKESDTATSSGVGKDVKEFVDGYESFMNSYCDFMENYDSSDTSALTEYTKMLGEYADWAQKADNLDESGWNNAETAYWLDAQNRINKRLLEVNQ